MEHWLVINQELTLNTSGVEGHRNPQAPLNLHNFHSGSVCGPDDYSKCCFARLTISVSKSTTV